ncbi:uncharacterized protein MELLADRAFT_49879 [Melampsora larici-populina 98AG31]|uniref:Peroxidase n=1 Tax=Melampsora larici-populina (strain 98AG31 / pathotype 3-4-7) TaxID=747676 RepID=F4RZH2_MELLP|nr:uncharacterized protein MELLADRAFT_49879 [Melampsora larici-populina 98AG31]EGG02255.1 hypothetical protein MELLADRAFT_49879 [Melampsora larici-populina 98AG31]
MRPTRTLPKSTRYPLSIPAVFNSRSAPLSTASTQPDPSFPPPPPPKSSNTFFYGGAIGITALGLAYYAYAKDSDSQAEVQSRYTAVKSANKNLDYQAIYNDIAEVLDNNDYDDGSYAPVLVRLAWHASGTYDKESKTGGSNGATMRFAPESGHGANAGLGAARDLLEPIYKKYAAKGLTYSDLWTLAGVVAIQEIGGPKILWRPGRQDGVGPQNCTPDGRLPDGDKDQDHIRKIFYRMGFNDQVNNRHSPLHEDHDTNITRTSQTDLFVIVDPQLKESRALWTTQYEDIETKSLMMLTTDMSLVMDKSFALGLKNEQAFFHDFSRAFSKLIELGVPEKNFGGKQPFELKNLDEA